MRDPLAPVIEGFDLSGIVNRYSFECEPFFTDKAESVTMLDGSTVHDVFPLKARFSWALNSLSARQYAALDAALLDTVTATIFDPTINATRSGRFHVTRPTFVFNFVTHDYMSTAGSALILEDTAPRTLSAAPFTRTAATPRDPLAPIIERYDLSGIVNRYSLQCEPFFTDGGNGGTLQDGSTILDVLADKFRFSWTLNAISAQQYADLCAVLSAGTVPDTLSASVFNPVLRAGYTAPFHITFPADRFAVDANGQCMAFADSALTLEETSSKRGIPVAGDDDWTLFDDGTLSLDPLPDGGDEADRWRRILDDLDDPPGDPARPILNVDRVQLNPGVPSLPSGVLDQFPNLDDVVIPPDVEIDPDAFDNCPALTVIKIVSFPRKSHYAAGESLDYSGLRVVEIFDGSERDITTVCVLLPAEGYTTTVEEDIMVDVRYHDKSLGTFWLAVRSVIDGGDWWTLYDSGLLYIFIEGDMPDYNWNGSPWYSDRAQISSVTIGDSVTSIGSNAFYGYRALTSVTIPGSVTSIGSYAFYDCSSLTSVTIPDGVTSIGSDAFYGCRALTSVTIPGSVTSIRAGAFSDCTSLLSIQVDSDNNHVSSEYGVLFNKNQTTLICYPAGKTDSSYQIPDSVTSIGSNAFFGCRALTSVTIPGSVTSIGNWVFRDCKSLTSVTIPDGVTSIGSNAFYGCRALTSVTIPGSVTSIGSFAFYGCTRLSDVYYSGTETQWDNITIGSSNTPLTSATIHYNSTGST